MPIVRPTEGRQELCELFAASGLRYGAEIGVWTGAFSEQLCRTIPALHLLCVDPWTSYKHYNEKKNNQARLDTAYAEACDRLAPYRVDILRVPSVEAAERISDGSLDFVYIDGNHERSFVAADLRAWTSKVRIGGIVSGHDYELTRKSKWIDVREAVDAYVTVHGIDPLFVLSADKSPSFYWVRR